MPYRKIHDTFWTDADFEDLTAEQRYFYLYLLTNPENNQIGLYEFSIKQAVVRTGLSADKITELLTMFEKMNRITRSKQTKEVVIHNFWKHNGSNSPSVIIHARELFNSVKDKSLTVCIHGVDTIYPQGTQEEEEKEEEQEEEKNRYGDFVFLYDKEYQKLVKEHGKEKADKFVYVLNNYKGSSGKSYKSDYRAILSWVVDKVNSDKQPTERIEASTNFEY